jgi:nucleoside-diphosphate-sugar epimerase
MRCALLASSANIYGNAVNSPIRETEPPRPANDYAVSKLAMEHMANLWSGVVPVTVVRPFNYTGVGQAAHFVVPKIVNAFRDRVPQLELGNIDVERDLSDVRDVVEAYARLLEAAPGGVFNICSGRSVSLGEIMAIAGELAGYRPAIVINPAFVRANEVRRLSGSNEKLLSAIGPWTPRPMRQTLEWMLASGDAFGKLTA